MKISPAVKDSIKADIRVYLLSQGLTIDGACDMIIEWKMFVNDPMEATLWRLFQKAVYDKDIWRIYQYAHDGHIWTMLKQIRQELLLENL